MADHGQKPIDLRPLLGCGSSGLTPIFTLLNPTLFCGHAGNHRILLRTGLA